jgi:hypothetical protein
MMGRVLALLLLLVGLAVVALGAVYTWNYRYGLAYWHSWYTNDRHVPNVMVTVNAQDRGCTDPQYPIAVELENKSGRTVERVSFYLVAKRPGRSSNLVSGGQRSSDHILAPGQKIGLCFREPQLSEAVEDPRKNLEWSHDIKIVTFAN